MPQTCINNDKEADAESEKLDDEEETPDSSTTTTTDSDDEVKTDAGPAANGCMTHSAPRNIPNASAPVATCPPATHRRRELFSPNITSMKEMFDVSYAVQRIAEEKPRRKNVPEGNARAMFANAINGDDDDNNNDEELLTKRLKRQSHDDQVEEARAQLDDALAIRDSPQLVPPPSQEDTSKLLSKAKKSNKGMFELNMVNATLLGRRRKPTDSSPLARAPSS